MGAFVRVGPPIQGITKKYRRHNLASIMCKLLPRRCLPIPILGWKELRKSCERVRFFNSTAFRLPKGKNESQFPQNRPL